MQFTSAAHQLSEAIKSYLKDNPKMTLNRLANESCVSEASLRRVVNLETKIATNLTLTLKVLRYITGDKCLTGLCQGFPGPLQDYLYKELSIELLNQNQKDFKKQLESKVNDPVIFHVVALAGSAAGVSEEQVEDFFGIEGIKALFNLFEHDFIYLQDGRFYTNENGMSFNRNIYKPVLLKAIDKIDASGSPLEMDNYFYLWTASLNDKAIGKIKKLQREHYTKLKDICKSESGDKHMFFFGALDSYKNNGLKK